MNPVPTSLLNPQSAERFGWPARLAPKLTGLAALDEVYRQRPAALNPAQFSRYALQQLNLSYTLKSGGDIPPDGGLIVICNHPHGLSDQLVLIDLLLSQRQDLLVFGEHPLAQVDELAALFSPAPITTAGAARSALRHLKSGGVLLLFPAGKPSRLDWHDRRVRDPRWSGIAALLARRSAAPVLPMYIEGRASLPLLLADSLRLRRVFTAQELLSQRNQHMSLHLGQAIGRNELQRLAPQAQTAYLRLLCENLKRRAEVSGAATAVSQARAKPAPIMQPRVMQPLADAIASNVMAAEIEALPESSLLCEQGELAVYIAGAQQIPSLLEEIGRLRELSYRQVQEGTGKARDLDKYDAHYQHLFIWHREKLEIVGAYRIGFSEDLIRQGGLSALYTHSLFQYQHALFDHLGPALEMGRSFVAPQWQRNFRPLKLLWAGISVLLDTRPEIRCLFGPVSISASYSRTSRALMQAALSSHHSDPQLQTLVQPRTPMAKQREARETREIVAALSDPAALSRLVARIDNGTGMPVLVRQYLELKGRFAGFNVDADFADTLDGLVFVQVKNIPAATRSKLASGTQRPGHAQPPPEHPA